MKNETAESTAVELAKESQWQWECRLVRGVIDAYSQVKQLPVICAISYDPAPPAHSRKWSPDSAHYCCDVEHAVRDVCAGDAELLASWARLLEEDAPIGKSDVKTIRKLAKVFEVRGLHPARYFRIIRHGSPKRREA
jgi:hypothetical protein